MLTEDELFDMDDKELEMAFREAKADDNSPEINDVPTGEEVGIEEADELEQPDDQESDDNADTDDDTDEVDDEDFTEEEGDPDEEPEAEEEQPETDTDEVEEDVQPIQKRKFKANGLEYEFTPDEIMEQFPRVFGQAMDYTKKMQQIKPWRKTIDAIEQAQLSQEDINLAIDVLKGDKDAIGELLKRTGIDALDLDTEESNYVPKDYGRDETALALKDVVDEISADPEYAVTQKVLTNEWDENSWSTMTQDPQMIKALHIDVKSGVYNKVQPIAAKLKVYDGGHKSDLDYYKEAARVYFTEENANKAAQEQAEQAQAAKAAELAKVQREAAKREDVKKKAEKRKRAVPSKKSTGTKQSTTSYLDDSDEDFEKWYASLQDKY